MNSDNVDIIQQIIDDTSLKDDILMTWNLDEIINRSSVIKSLPKDSSQDTLQHQNSTQSKDILSHTDKTSLPFTLESKSSEELWDDEIQRLLNEASYIGKTTDDLFSFSEGIDPQDSNKSEATPLDFIHNYEIQNYKNSPWIPWNENIFQIRTFRQTTSVKYNIMKFTKKDQLFNRLNKDGLKVTCLFALNDKAIFAGYANGLIKTFTCDTQYEYKTYRTDEITNSVDKKKSVTSIYCYSKGDFFISGYENGWIILWDVETLKIKKTISGKHDYSIIAWSILKVEGGIIDLISSDMDGIVNHITVSEGIFTTSVNCSSIGNSESSDCPWFWVKTLDLKRVMDKGVDDTSTQKNNNNNNNNNQNYNLKNGVLVLGNVNTVEYVRVDKSIHRRVLLSNPKSKDWPDVAFGYGYTSYYTEGFTSNNNSINRRQNTSMCDFSKPQVLWTISWENQIHWYAISIINNEAFDPIEIGNYINNNPIIRIGFISESIIYFFDTEKEIKCLKTNWIIQINNTNNSSNSKQNEKNTNKSFKRIEWRDNKNKANNPLLQQGQVIDPNIIYISALINPESNWISKIYYQYIISFPRTIVLLCKEMLYQAKWLNWEECLKNWKENFQWLGLFSLGIDIYKAKVISLADIPIEAQYRKLRTKHIIKGYLKEYWEHNLPNVKGNNLTITEDDSILNNENKKIIENSKMHINITIELCIEMEWIEFLFEDILTVITNKGHKGRFFDQLEPFILKDKIKNQAITPDIIVSLIKIYFDNGKYYELSQMIPHLDLDSFLKNKEFFKNCIDKKWLTTVIYVNMKNRSGDYFQPIPLMFTAFKEGKEIFMTDPDNPGKKNTTSSTKNTNFVFFSNDYIKHASHIVYENSKEYIGHKMLWYCNWLLERKSYPDNCSLDSKEAKYRKAIPWLFLWLVSYEVINTLIAFDSYTYFTVLAKFFTDEEHYSIISKIPNENFKIFKENNNWSYVNSLTGNEMISDTNILDILNMIVSVSEENGNFWVWHDWYEFIVKASSNKSINIDISLMLKAAISILSYNKNNTHNLGNSSNSMDKFNCHKRMLNFNYKYIEELGDSWNEMIDTMKTDVNWFDEDDNKEDKFKTDYLQTLITASEWSPFTNVRIHWLELNEDYIHCIDVYINNRNERKDEEVFQFISKTLELLKKTGEESFVMFKQYIWEKLPNLADISISDVTKLVFTWFKEEQETVIHQLDSVPKVQLKYIETVIDSYREDESQLNDVDNSKLQEEYSKLLFLQVTLWIKLNRKDQVFKYIKEYSNYYPLHDCLQLCLEYNIIDASIYWYKLLGSSSNAWSWSIGQIKIITENIKKNIYSNTFELKHYIEDLTTNIASSVEICEGDSSNESNNYTDNEDLWFTWWNEWYAVLKEWSKLTENQNLKKLKWSWSENIERLLKKMCCYVSIQKVIEKVTKNYQDVEFKEFKDWWNKMWNSFENLCKVWGSAKTWFTNSVIYNVNEFKKWNWQGQIFELDKCDACGKRFKKELDEHLLCAFNCGHKSHLKCSIREYDSYICKVCRRNDIELSNWTYDGRGGGLFESKRRKSTNWDLYEVSNNMKSSSNNNNTKDKTEEDRRNKDYMMGKLKMLDKLYLEKVDWLN